MSNSEVETVLDGLRTESFASRDKQEVAGYARAMELVYDSAELLPVTENHIRQLHSVLLQFSTKDERHRGTWKTLPNRVAAFDADGKEVGVIFETTTPFDTPSEMEKLTTWLIRRERNRDLHPLLVIGTYIVVFLKIHPFQDGNGRLFPGAGLRFCCFGLVTHTCPTPRLSPLSNKTKTPIIGLSGPRKSTLGDGNNTDLEPWLGFFLLMLQRQTKALGKRVDALHQTLNQLSQAERDLLEIVEDQRPSECRPSRSTDRPKPKHHPQTPRRTGLQGTPYPRRKRSQLRLPETLSH